MKYQQFSDETLDLRVELKGLRRNVGLMEQQFPVISVEKTAMATEGAPARAAIGEEETPTSAFKERQIKTWDLVDVSYLERGAVVARSVCKLHGRDDQGPYVGTAFMISDRLLMTNQHNLPTKEIASNAFVEFEHELGPNGFPRDTQRFRLNPEEAFWENAELDICVVAIAPTSQGGVPATRYGYLRLDPTPGKISEGEFITLIHHPDGDWKQVALRENRLLRTDQQLLWYASDTSPGSSGAPCFSDKWQVVAVHRRGVPQTKEDDDNLIALRNGDYVTKEQIKSLRIPDHMILWVANEGTRISVLLDMIGNDPAATGNDLIADWREGVTPTQNRIPAVSYFTQIDPSDFRENRRPRDDYEKRNGYQHDFLGFEIPPPSMDKTIQMWGRASYNSDTGESEFPYYNFSVWMNRERRMAFVAAVNIDGENHNARNRDEFGDDKWVYDDRLPERLQIGNWFYGNEPARYNKNYFDRGHIVRRTEPSWGPTDIAQLANDDTFHWTNCSPQYKSFNQQSRFWQGLEQYLLEDGAVNHRKRMTLFTGPIFSEEDTEHRSVLVPKAFFKVAVFVGQGGKLRSAAYVLDQSKWVDIIDFERAPQFDVHMVRQSIRWLEDRTGLDFGEMVREADGAKNLYDDFAAISQLPDLFV